MYQQATAMKLAHNAYGTNQISTAPQKKLLIMLYDGAIKFLGDAEEAIGKKDFPLAHKQLTRTQDILTELMATLNFDQGGEIATSLWSLYDFLNQHLVEANVDKDAAKVGTVRAMMVELREVWNQI